MRLHSSIPQTPVRMSVRGAFVRNVLVGATNGGITLVILLIAPLGLAAVLTNTVLVGVTTFGVCMGADAVVAWLLPSSSAELLSRPAETEGKRRRSSALDRRQRDW